MNKKVIFIVIGLVANMFMTTAQSGDKTMVSTTTIQENATLFKVTPSDDMDANCILELEKQALRRWLNRDVWGYLALFSKDATYFDEGTVDKIKGLKAITAYIEPWQGKIYVPKYEFRNTDIKVNGNMGVLSYNLYNFNEQGEQTLLWNATEIYEKINGNWKIIHAHWAIVKEKKN